MMVPCGEGQWSFILIKMGNTRDNGPLKFMETIEAYMNEDWELHGQTFSHDGHIFQAMIKFFQDEQECDGGDDDDGLPLPEAENEPIQEVRNCS